VLVKVPNRLLKTRKTCNLLFLDVWLLCNLPNIAVNIFFRITMSSKKHLNLLSIYSSKLAVIQYFVCYFLKYLNVNVTCKVIPEQLNTIQVRSPLGTLTSLSRSRSVQGTLDLFLWIEQVQPLNIWSTLLTPTLLSIWRR